MPQVIPKVNRKNRMTARQGEAGGPSDTLIRSEWMYRRPTDRGGPGFQKLPAGHPGRPDPQDPGVGPPPRVRHRQMARRNHRRRPDHRGRLALPGPVPDGTQRVDRSRVGHVGTRPESQVLRADLAGPGPASSGSGRLAPGQRGHRQGAGCRGRESLTPCSNSVAGFAVSGGGPRSRMRSRPKSSFISRCGSRNWKPAAWRRRRPGPKRWPGPSPPGRSTRCCSGPGRSGDDAPDRMRSDVR